MSLSMGEPKEIRMIVFSALLTALNEVMGRDGKNSVLRFAGLEKYINQDIPPSLEESISFKTFRALIDSMNDLLGHGTDAILYESGRKFAIYLTPFGFSLKEVAEKLSNWIGGTWIVLEDNNKGVVQIKNNPVCKGLVSDRPSCHVISGALAKIKEESTGKRYLVKEISCESKGDSCCEFHILQQKKPDEVDDYGP
ncbi:MAG TPA: V4R domain-containing protein [Candidatus Deferrimicrobium sp.]|nr:V4R domain-containing protein [Candidatus Deferrimicrobium sp.]